jgi:hypothetical protein
MKKQFYPILITTTLATALLLTPVLSQPVRNQGGTSQASLGTLQKEGPVHTEPGDEKTYLRLNEAADLLQKGSDTAAARLLDEARADNLVIRAGDLGAGPLNTFSSTTLMMRLARLMSHRAEEAMAAGDRTAALSWVGRSQSLARQVLATTEPTLDALKVARYLDQSAGRVEVEVRRRWDTPTHVAAVTKREYQLKQLWKDVILGRIMDVRGVTPTQEADTHGEAELATDLITFYQTQRTAAFAMLDTADIMSHGS